MADDWKVGFYSTFFGIYMIEIIAGSILWHLNRHKRPLNARVYFFVVYFHIVSALMGIRLLLTMVDAISEFTTAVLEVISLPLYFNCILLSAFRLYFIFSLTETKVKIQREESNEAISTTTETTSKYSGNWYLKHRYLLATKNLIILFFVVTSAMTAIYLAIVIPIYDLVSFEAVTAAVNFILIVSFIFLVFVCIRLRTVKDGYHIKNEYYAQTISWVVMSVIIAFFATEPWTGLGGSFNLRFFALLAHMAAYGSAVWLPLYHHYFKQTDAVELSNIELKTEGIYDFETIYSLISEPKMQELFLQFLSTQFQVEDIFFLKKLKEYKQEPKLYVGRAVIIYQKFLKPDAFLDLHIPEELVKDIAAIANDEEAALSSDAINGNFFDKVESYVIDRLSEPFRLFTQTKEFRELKAHIQNESRLEQGYKIMGVQ